MFPRGVLLLASTFALGEALNYNKSLNSQVRSAYHGSTGITISWNTYDELSNPTVHYGLNVNQLDQIATGNVSVTYNTSLTYNNHVQISGLLPNMQYYYLPEHLLPDAVPEPFTFTTSRPLGDNTPLHVAVVIDMGAMGDEGLTTYAGTGVASQEILLPGEQNTIQSLASQTSTFDFVAHPGDLAYADTWLKETQGGFINGNATYSQAYKAYESILDDFFDQLTPITTRLPYMVSPGNHEANCLNKASSLCMPGQENFTGYVNHWRMPSDVATQAPNNLGVGNMWYSYDHGMVHFVSVDTETDIPNAPDADYPAGPFAPSGQQVAWLKADLAAVNRSVTPWVIVFGHRPYYTSGDSCAPCQAAFEDIFIEYNVDLVMNGHFHVFERNAPIGKNGTIDPNGLNNPAAPWYIINGLGGHYAGLDTFSQIQPYQDFGIDLNNATYGWSRLTFHNCSHLTHELVNSSSNAVIDTATLYKARSCSSAIINNYDIPGFEKPVSLSGAIQAPRSYMGYSHLDTFNPSQCAAICNSKKASDGNYACDFFTVYAEQIDGVSEGAFCAFYSSTWNTTYATNHGQYRGGKHVTISDAYSYSRST
ncbi:Metallo-dependent phosphatase, partial [Aureobasidium melanogenum]